MNSMIAFVAGLDGKSESLSFHHATETDVYIRTNQGLVYFDDSTNPTYSPGSFNEDASFAIRKSKFVDVSYEL